MRMQKMQCMGKTHTHFGQEPHFPTLMPTRPTPTNTHARCTMDGYNVCVCVCALRLDSVRASRLSDAAGGVAGGSGGGSRVEVEAGGVVGL